MTITLIGMSGAGKSAVAGPLARMLGGEVVDVDALIEAQTGETLAQTLKKGGDAEFLRIESEVICALEQKPNSIIATGGSVVLVPRAMEHLKKISRVAYLLVPFELIERRRPSGAESNIVGSGSKTLRQVYDERLPLYEKYADIVIDAGEGGAKEVAEKIYRAILKN